MNRDDLQTVSIYFARFAVRRTAFTSLVASSKGAAAGSANFANKVVAADLDTRLGPGATA